MCFFRVMGEILDSWVTKDGLTVADTATLASILDQARFSLHAKAIRDMSEDTGKNTIKRNKSRLQLRKIPYDVSSSFGYLTF